MEILLVEDHDLTAQSICTALSARHQVTHVENCQKAIAAVNDRRFDAVLLDISLPDGSGLQLCDYFEQEDMPSLIVLSGNSNLQMKVNALTNGVDDYMVKPFTQVELHARLLAVNRRRQKKLPQQIIKKRGFEFSAAERYFKTISEMICFTSSETALLSLFLKREGQTVSRNTFAETLQHASGESTSLETHIKNIRRKLKNSKMIKIETIYGIGYRCRLNDENTATHPTH
jgi:DNA-binding response OmpR family regulator